MDRRRRDVFGVGRMMCFWALANLCSIAAATECDYYTSNASRIILRLPISSKTPVDAAYLAWSQPTLFQASPEKQGKRASGPERFTVNGNLLEAIFCSYEILPNTPTVVTIGPKSIIVNANQVTLRGVDTSGRKIIEVVSSDAVVIDWPTVKDGYIQRRKDTDGLDIKLQFDAVAAGDIRAGKITVVIVKVQTICRAISNVARDARTAHMVKILVSVNGGPNMLMDAKRYDGTSCGPPAALTFELPDTKVTILNRKMSLTVAAQKSATASASSATTLDPVAIILSSPPDHLRGDLHVSLNFNGGNLYLQEIALRTQ